MEPGAYCSGKDAVSDPFSILRQSQNLPATTAEDAVSFIITDQPTFSARSWSGAAAYGGRGEMEASGSRQALDMQKESWPLAVHAV